MLTPLELPVGRMVGSTLFKTLVFFKTVTFSSPNW